MTVRQLAKHCLLRSFGVVERVPAGAGVLLTFDDGPHPDVTPAVLDLLAQYDARAVFFVVGNRIPRAPHLLQRILAEGHLIGNHTYEHPLDRIPRMAEYRRDVRQCQDILGELTGRTPYWFRPPLGALTPASLLAPRLCGLRTLLWSIDVGDWTLRRPDEAVQAGERLAVEANPGDVVLLHDDNPCVVTLLKAALPRLRDRNLGTANGLDNLLRPCAFNE